MKYQYTLASETPIQITLTISDLKLLDKTMMADGQNWSSYDQRREIHTDIRKAIQAAYSSMDLEHKCYHDDYSVSKIEYAVKTKEQEDA